MKNHKLTAIQKITASVFALMVLASVGFIGYRIMTKSDYEAAELRQVQILAVSAIETLAEKTYREPDLWSKFSEDNIILIIDHKLMPGNWVIMVSIKQGKDFIEIESSASSGWNSRSPKNALYTAKIFNSGEINYNDIYSDELAKQLRKTTSKEKKHFVIFRFQDEIKICPVQIRAAVLNYKESDNKSFLFLKLTD